MELINKKPLFLSMRFLVCVCILFNCFHLKAQREVNVWHFGSGAGIDFNATPPLVVTDGKLQTMEGCASICDAFGKLLMYTDGDTVYNGNHQMMVNGYGLHGDYSSAQSAMIIKLPKSDSLYLIFNPAENYGIVTGFYYSVVNVYAKGGKGEVITKNVLLKANMHTESVSAVKHANGDDVWVVFKNDNSNEFVSYLVTPLGVSNVMTFSQPGPTIGTGNPAGFTYCSKFSPSGKKYAICIPAKGVCLYDFDNKTGYLANLMIIPLSGCYGVEFSPNEKKLYASSPGKGLYQYDISSNNLSNIIASEYLFAQKSFGSIQLAPDKKIYVAQLTSNYLTVIHSPNLAKAASDYRYDDLFLKGRLSQYGLPPFISTYFSDTIISSINYTGKCIGDAFQFECTNMKSGDSIAWDFGDPGSGQNNFSQLLKSSHVYNSTGKFIIQAAIFRKNINNHFVPDGVLDTFIMVSGYLGKANEYPLTLSKCINDSVLVQAASGGTGLGKVLWNDIPGSILSRTITNPGLYVATVYKTGSNCFYKDSLNVTDKLYTLKPDLGPDTVYCLPLNQALNKTQGTQLAYADKFLWNTGATSKTITVTKTGTYSVIAENNNKCPSADTILVSIAYFSDYTRLRDTAFCKDNNLNKLTLKVNNYQSVAWNTGESGTVVTIASSGKYWYTIRNQCGILTDSFDVQLMDAPVVDLGKDLTVCSANGFELKSNVSGNSYLWLPGGEISQSIISYDYGMISLEVGNTIGCKGRDEIFINDSCRQECFVPNVFTPNTDGLNDVFKPANNDIGSKGYVFRVYDRWGSILFETDNVKAGWNGMVNDNLCVSGIYFYTLEFVTTKRKTIHMKGTFTLLY